MLLHKLFGKILAALQLGCFLLRTYHRNTFQLLIVQEKVMNAFYQRFLGANQNQVDVIAEHKSLDAFKVGNFKVNIGAILRSTGITGCNKKVLTLWTLSDFPGEGTFPSARTEDQDIHG